MVVRSPHVHNPSLTQFDIHGSLEVSKDELRIWASGPGLDSVFGDNFPLARDHPDWRELERENDEYVERAWQFDDLEVKRYLMESQLAEFSTMCFPFGERHRLLQICKLVTLLFVLDEDLDRHRNLHLLPILKALTEGTRTPENNYAEIAINEVWREIERTSDPTSFKQFVRITHEYFDSHGQIPYEGFKQYVAARRTNVGSYFMWACLRYVMDINLSDEELRHSKVQALVDAAGFHIAYVNDLLSYTKEALTDTATNNILTLLQKNDGLTPQAAELKLRREIKEAEELYQDAARSLLDDPVLGRKEDIRKLIVNIPYGMGGNVWWSLVTKRYNADPQNHLLPAFDVNIDPRMRYHPEAERFRKQPATVAPSVVSVSAAQKQLSSRPCLYARLTLMWPYVFLASCLSGMAIILYAPA